MNNILWVEVINWLNKYHQSKNLDLLSYDVLGKMIFDEEFADNSIPDSLLLAIILRCPQLDTWKIPLRDTLNRRANIRMMTVSEYLDMLVRNVK